ncbi:MAG TPA: ZIP family metal transporter [Thermoleophilia bacterium]|nr:ZIP family metal transporter [Thermoleophilia bacterium]
MTTVDTLGAFLWGLVGGGALVVGAAAGLAFRVPQRVIGLVMAFGAGVLISALSFELTADAYDLGGADAVAVGLALGALAFFAGDWFIDDRGGRHRKRSGGQQAEGQAPAIVLGAILDGIPESVAMGISLLAGGGASAAFVAAVFVSNVPEAMSASTGLRKAGARPRSILTLWVVVALVSGISSAFGFAALGGAPDHVQGAIEAFAGGAILVMLADTMMPEAFEEAHKTVGLVTVLGYALGAFLSVVA